MKPSLTFSALASLLLAALPGAAHAQTITAWNFNSTAPDANTSTGVLTPSTGSGSLSLAGGTTSTFSSGSPADPGLNVTTFPAQSAGSGAAGVQFNVSTAGYAGALQISLDFRQSGTASRYFQLQLSTNGTTFANATGGTGAVGTQTTNTNTLTSFDNNGLYTNNAGGGTQNFVTGITYTLSPGSAFANDATFAFRWVAVFDPASAAPGSYISSNAGTAAAYSTAGTARFDDVSVAQVPEPSTYALLCLAGAGLSLVVRRRAVWG